MNGVILKAMEEAAGNAGKIIMAAFRTSFNRSFKEKSHNYKSLVTEVDIKSQKIIQETLIRSLEKNHFDKNKIGFIGEESLNTKGEHLFIIDPIDGTINFSFGYPYFCVSIGYMHEGKIICGLVFNPNENTFYIAEVGKGAHKILNNQKTKLLVRNQEIKDSILAAHYNYDFATRHKQFGVYEKLSSQIAGIRTNGSITLDLCIFVENRYQIVINGGCFIWDLAAVSLIIKEAGGSLTDWEGKEIKLFTHDLKRTYKILACSPNNLSRLLIVFRQ